MQGNFPKTDLEFPFGGGEHHANSKSNNTGFGMCAGTHAGNNLSDLSQVLSRRSRAVLSESSADGIVGTVTVKADEISRLFVLPEQQRKGYGQALLAYAEQQVFAAYPQATLDASLPAKAMYLKQGYHAQAFHSLPAEGLTFLCYDVMVKAR